MGKFEVAIERPTAESASASGGFAPDPVSGALPLDFVGAPHPDLRYRLTLPCSPWHGAVPLRCCRLEPPLDLHEIFR